MKTSKLKAKTATELRSLADNDNIEELKDALTLLHSWGIHDPEYLSVLGRLLSHEDAQVVRLTLGIMLNLERYGVNEFVRLRRFLPALRKMLKTQPLALDVIVALRGPSRDLVPHLKKYLHRFPEEGCDLIVRFGPIARDLVPDLMRLLRKDDWDELWAAVDAVAAIGREAKKAVPILQKLTKHKSEIIADRALLALENITGVPRHIWQQRL